MFKGGSLSTKLTSGKAVSVVYSTVCTKHGKPGQAMDRQVSLGEDLVLTLSEFDDALQDFTRGPCDFEEHLKNLKQQHQTSLNNISSDSESVSSSQRSSLNTSEENLSFSFTNTRHHPKAKLGDTRELENFISDLDKVLSDF